MSALAALAITGLLCGAAAQWVFRRLVDGPAVRTLLDRIHAHLLEFWLFVDEPRTIWKSWRGLLAANARLLGRLLVPLLLMSIPGLPLFFFLDAVFATSPLAVGRPALVTVGFSGPLDKLAAAPQLHVPAGISIESPAVRVFSEHQVSWRIRPARAVSGKIECIAGDQEREIGVVAGTRFGYHAPRRVQSWSAWLRYPAAAPLAAGPVSWIEVSYPASEISPDGLDLPWFVWFAAFSLCGAVASLALLR